MNQLLTQKFLQLSLVSLSVFGILAPSVQATTPQSSQSPIAELQIAQEMGCPRAEMIASFATDTYHISICQGQDGYLFYRGVEYANPYNAINVSTVYLSGNGNGTGNHYDAVNGDVTYSIDAYTLSVWQEGSVIWQENVISSYEPGFQ